MSVPARSASFTSSPRSRSTSVSRSRSHTRSVDSASRSLTPPPRSSDAVRQSRSRSTSRSRAGRNRRTSSPPSAPTPAHTSDRENAVASASSSVGDLATNRDDATRVFAVSELTVQFYFSRRALLRVDAESVWVAAEDEEVFDEEGRPARVVGEAGGKGLPGSDGWQLLDFVDKILLMDVGKLLGDRLETASLIFQLNSRAGVNIFQATSEKQKREIFNLIRVMTELKIASPVSSSETRIKSASRYALVANINYPLRNPFMSLTRPSTYALSEQSVKSASDLHVFVRTGLEEKTAALSAIVAKFEELDALNASLAETLETCRQENEALMARVAEVDRTSRDAATIISTMQQRVDDKAQAMEKGARLLELIEIRMKNPLAGKEWTWRHMAVGGKHPLPPA
ncbi:hypothetical protein BDK51DRAFT_31000 [Blyttiomyces helicus]|uniref:Uncharacterized protein n=1 Tax=Blyttiomyces helicus TaxID=388810 RepID=A0A4P9WF60_9FUNG|nr:hypothetical protein BDK51DRAFT_31000 [Blyttiomyces helicus]|eukprot:RKO91361.1 hypothetical protein BDK51DRAFT_31000 [Blyttiomyces helicus]